jgi:DNA-binding Lrp family transcriptional regulator
MAFGGRENARRILVALEEDSSRTSPDLADRLGLKADTVRFNRRWLEQRELGPESGLDAVLRLGLEQGTLDAWIERSLRVDRERQAADLYVREHAGMDRVTGELL